jgi:hypothetical protein
MKDQKASKRIKPLSLEEQQREAKQDATGKIRKYLELAEKLFNTDRDMTPDAA